MKKFSFVHLLSAVLVAFAATACKNAPQTTEEINDSTTPLHLLKPDYKVPYGELTADEVKADLERVFAYIDSERPKGFVDADGNEVPDNKRLYPLEEGISLHRGAFRIGSYEWGITYRRIPPSYEIYSHMGLFQRDLSNFEETVLIENRELNGTCLNCHTANRTNPDQYVFHARGDHGATIIHRNGKEEYLKARNDSLGGAMVYPYWHPGGRYCAFSTNKTSQMFHTANPKKRIEVYDSSSDVFVYDTETQTIIRDTLIMKKYWAENTPAFSPDGKWLYFTTARRQVYPTDYDKEKYSLCRVSFDAETGHIGTKVDTLVNTAQTGKSVSWPRVSYDGRFLMYAEADYGYFTVWHPEADLWLLDLNNGTTRRMDEVNSQRSESLHAWSKNSHWFLFTSRRDDGLYTRLYFASIDATGRATKPFMLPQRNPKEYYRRLMYSYNTPDFTSKMVNIDKDAAYREIESDKRTETKK